MAKLGVGGDERLEPEGPERPAVVDLLTPAAASDRSGGVVHARDGVDPTPALAAHVARQPEHLVEMLDEVADFVVSVSSKDRLPPSV